MFTLFRQACFLLGVCAPAMAATVVITSLPDQAHPLDPLTAPSGVPLANGTEVLVGAFPGMSDDDILNMAAAGGYTDIAAAFVPFGETQRIGDGVGGADGRFEIAVHQNSPDGTAAWVGEEVTILVKPGTGEEFLVARFKGSRFAADSDTGLTGMLTLHLADSKLIVGNRYGTTKFSTSSAPEIGGFEAWIAGFSSITDPAKRHPGADADGDGRSNFMEYATGGDPTKPADLPACQLAMDDAGDFWIRFSRAAGIGSISHTVEASGDLVSQWQSVEGNLEPDPNPPVGGSPNWMRMRVPQPMARQGFFRLKSESPEISE